MRDGHQLVNQNLKVMITFFIVSLLLALISTVVFMIAREIGSNKAKQNNWLFSTIVFWVWCFIYASILLARNEAFKTWFLNN